MTFWAAPTREVPMLVPLPTSFQQLNVEGVGKSLPR